MCHVLLLFTVTGKKMNIFSVRGKNSEAENLHKAGKLQMLKQKQTNKKKNHFTAKGKKTKQTSTHTIHHCHMKGVKTIIFPVRDRKTQTVLS